MTSKGPRVFYGWWIVGVSAIGLFLGAPLLVFSFSVFFKPLVLNFHASRAAVSFAFSLQNSVGALWIPLTGMLIDRLGAKRVIIWMTLFYGLILISALWVGSSIWQLYLFFSLAGIGLSGGPSPVPYGVVISHWFNRRRGLALGLAMLGIGVGSIDGSHSGPTVDHDLRLADHLCGLWSAQSCCTAPYRRSPAAERPRPTWFGTGWRRDRPRLRFCPGKRNRA